MPAAQDAPGHSLAHATDSDEADVHETPKTALFASLTSHQLPTHPFDSATDVVDDVAGLQMIGQHVPRIRLNLKLARQRFLFVHLERLFESKACRPEQATQVIEEHRNMEVRAPFARAWIRLARGK